MAEQIEAALCQAARPETKKIQAAEPLPIPDTVEQITPHGENFVPPPEFLMLRPTSILSTRVAEPSWRTSQTCQYASRQFCSRHAPAASQALQLVAPSWFNRTWFNRLVQAPTELEPGGGQGLASA